MRERTEVCSPAERPSESIIEMLFENYYELQAKDDPRLEIAYRDFCHSILELDPLIADDIMGTAAVLCMEHERAAFIAGMKTRDRLLRELSE